MCRKCSVELAEGSVYCNWCGTRQEAKRVSHRRGNGLGSAYKRGKSWYVEITTGWRSDGSRAKKKKGGFATKREALEYAHSLRSQPDLAPRTLQYYYDSWAKSDLPKLSSSKQTAYKIAWKKLSAIHMTKISQLTIVKLRDIVSEVAETFYPARDIKYLLSQLFDLAIADQQTTVNMAKYITLPSLEEKEQSAWDQRELATIWTSYDDGNVIAAYLLLMIYSGMMPGELCICTKGMIHIDDRQIIGAGLKTGIRKKTPIVIADVIVPVLSRIFSYTPEGEEQKILYTDRWSFYEAYHAFTSEYGLRDLPMYSCRHTTATALAIGTDAAPSIIQKVMRHAKFTTTQRYIHPDTSDSLAAVNKLSLPTPQSLPNADFQP